MLLALRAQIIMTVNGASLPTSSVRENFTPYIGDGIRTINLLLEHGANRQDVS
jgi:hypothetical protein